jgi:hypothetical protein
LPDSLFDLLVDLFHPALAGVFFDRLHTEKQFQNAQEWARILICIPQATQAISIHWAKPASVQAIVLYTTAIF